MAACKTVKVRAPDGGVTTINESDFNPDVHKLAVDDDPKPEPRSGRRRSRGAEGSGSGEDEDGGGDDADG